jgi:mono/diheme cytochrome c family protein
LPPVLLLASLSSAQMAGLALMAAAFIVFALVSSFLLPRKWPNFPGKYLWAYVAVVGCFFAGMMATVVFVAKESAEAQAETTHTGPASRPAIAPVGSVAAGKQLFTSAGCVACHTYTPAGSHGTVGPNLDKLATDAAKANRGSLAQYVQESIVDPNAYVVPGYPGSVMPQTFGQQLSKSQVADLVAFLTKPS